MILGIIPDFAIHSILLLINIYRRYNIAMNEERPLHAEIIFNVLLIIALLILLGMIFLISRPKTVDQIEQNNSQNISISAQQEKILSEKNKILTKVSSPAPLTKTEKDEIFNMVGGEKGRVYNLSEAEWKVLIDKFNK